MPVRDFTGNKKMKRKTFLLIGILGVVVAAADVCNAQRPGPGRQRPGGNNANSAEDREEQVEEIKPLPNDKRLIRLHQTFVREAEKLAVEYEKDQQWDRAKDVYGEIIKLVPQYGPARVKMAQLLQREAQANKAQFVVDATQGWQDTGINVIEGKPITIRSKGTWTFTLEMELSADGVTIPEELSEWNLGCLLGLIDTGNPKEIGPFVVGRQISFVPEQSGRLRLRMYDVDPSDNEGSLTVEFLGTFQQQKGIADGPGSRTRP